MQDTENIKEIIKQLKDRDLQIRIKAVNDAQLAVTKNPSVKNLASLNRAMEMLDAATTEAPKEPEASYENRSEAAAVLQRQGYKIGKSKFYKDCKAGLCRMEADGSITESNLRRYIKHPKANIFKPKEIIEGDETQRQKGLEEVRKLRAQVRLLEIELAKKEAVVIDREAFYVEFAGMLGAIESAIKHSYAMNAYHWAEEVIKDPENSGALLLDILNKNQDKQFNAMAHLDRFEVRFTQEIGDQRSEIRDQRSE